MPTLEDKLDLFTKSIMSDAEADSAAIREEVRRTMETSLSRAENEALSDVYVYIKSKVSAIHTENGRRLSHKMMECKRALYARREALSEQILSDVRARVHAFVKTPAYAKKLTEFMQNALLVFGDAASVIFLRPEDMRLVPELKKAAGSRDVTFEPGAIRLGGLIAECPQLQRQINQTFDSNFEEWKTRFFVELVIANEEKAAKRAPRDSRSK